MRILIIGASGLIGAAVAARLLADGHHLVGAARRIDQSWRRQPAIAWIRADMATMSVADWASHTAGVDGVVNCAGALQDSPGDQLQAGHVRGLAVLLEACASAGVRRFVQISAAGMEGAAGAGAFLRSKARAEALLRDSSLDWVILRPVFVFGAAAYGGSALLRGLAAFPGFIPAIHARAVVQVVAAEDIAEAVVRSLVRGAPSNLICDLAAAEATTVGDILRSLRAWVGLPSAPLVDLPPVVGAVTAAVADALAFLGWKSPLRSAALAQLAAGVRGAGLDAPEMLGFSPRSLSQLLAARPAGLQERWFSRLYFAKPAAVATLSLFWLISGFVGVLQIDAAATVLTASGMSADMARGFVITGGCTDIALGLGVMFRPTAPLALKGMMAVTAAYLAGATIWRPDLWFDPLGVLVKTIPAALLALITLALLDDR